MLKYSPLPKFEEGLDSIIAAGECTSFLLIEEQTSSGGRIHRAYATAFFISDHLLLTAGHNVTGVNGPVSELRITYPGLEHANPWHVTSRKMATIKCTVLGTIYTRNGEVSKDIAILDAGSFRAAKWLSLSSVIPARNAIIDVVGYPGESIYEWVEAHQALFDYRKAKEDVDEMLKTGSLTVTRGTIATVGTNHLTYQISTCPGFGGSSVLYKGSIIGEFDIKKADREVCISVNFIRIAIVCRWQLRLLAMRLFDFFTSMVWPLNRRRYFEFHLLFP